MNYSTMQSVLTKLGYFKKSNLEDWPKYAQQTVQTVDDVRSATSEIHKTLESTLLIRKDKKKSSFEKLGGTMQKGAEKCSQSKLFSDFFSQSADLCKSLASLHREYEAQVDACVSKPLSYLYMTTCEEISKQQRNLTKASTDVRNTQEQLQRATINASANENYAQFDTNPRISHLQDQLAMKEADLSESKDKMLGMLYTFALDQGEHVECMIELYRQLKAYFEKCVKLLNTSIPKLTAIVEKGKPLVAFGRSLPVHLDETGRSIAYPLEICVKNLDNEQALTFEGLFRKSASLKKVEMIAKAASLMLMDNILLAECNEIILSNVLKQYLRSLPEPLVTYNLAVKWAEIAKPGPNTPPPSDADKMELVTSSLKNMPISYSRNLAYLFLFLAKVNAKSEVNKMPASNLAIVIVPNIYWLPEEFLNEAVGADANARMLYSNNLGISLFELLMQNVDILFPAETGQSSKWTRHPLPPPVPLSQAGSVTESASTCAGDVEPPMVDADRRRPIPAKWRSIITTPPKARSTELINQTSSSDRASPWCNLTYSQSFLTILRKQGQAPHPPVSNSSPEATHAVTEETPCISVQHAPKHLALPAKLIPVERQNTNGAGKLSLKGPPPRPKCPLLSLSGDESAEGKSL